MAPKFVRHGQVYINLGNVYAECVHFLFSEIRDIVENSFSVNLSLKLFVWQIAGSMHEQFWLGNAFETYDKCVDYLNREAL
jgi:hypothetical protein